ncbi:hypothetical protein ACOME3_004699 [Neoechinorhynchus agilis]
MGGKKSRLHLRRLTSLKAEIEPEYIGRIEKTFRRIDTDQSGTLNLKELMAEGPLARNPFVRHLVAMFDVDGNGEIDFLEFINGICVFMKPLPVKTKIRYAFDIFDKNRDGYISKRELFDVTKMMVAGALDDKEIKNLVERGVTYNDFDGDGKINFDEFYRALGPAVISDVEHLLNVGPSDYKEEEYDDQEENSE